MTDTAPADHVIGLARNNALGAFLRARREAVQPSTVGLPADRGRRTPGLRRGELAMLAGVSVEYLTRLERGADRRPSPQVLGALAGALQLTDDERVHLLRLAKALDGDGTACSTSTPPPPRPALVTLMDQLARTPAVILDRAGGILARTPRFPDLCPSDVRNVPRFVFTDPRARDTFPDWDSVADEWAVRLRAATELGDPQARLLATEFALRARGDFVPRYERATRVPAWTGAERWTQPDGVTRTWAYEALGLPETDEHRLLVYLPA
ncbi:helix-turn-helix transcriptional regulator [Streptomyces sp. WMMB 322]|uniref:helix-turn-helix transcriptional regulator n=1 Tax=Streptomyces sp. WMMB 322 TaxID=1286821 RepID=UPI000823C0F8|nr:helix-turn-helix transcriptional regulator [Streptomyces sp. WMMB 322]SCK07934.1 Helix-turn-helix domain-containing protein [Streptomyces sp. WMMB 322]